MEPVVNRHYVLLMGDFFLTSYSHIQHYVKMYGCEFYTRCGFMINKFYYGPEAMDFGDVVFEIEKKKPGTIMKIFNYIYEIGDELMALAKEIRKTNWKGKSYEELVTQFKEFGKMYEFFSLSLMGYNIQFPIEKKLKDFIGKKENPDEALAILSFPKKENFPALEQKSLLALASKVKKYSSYSTLPNKIRKELEDHAEEYGWINARGGKGDSWTPEDIFKRAKELKGDYGVRLKELGTHQINAKNKSDELLDEMNADKEVRELVEMTKELVYFRTYRTDYLNKSFALIRPLLEEMGAKRNLSYYDMLYLLRKEIIDNIEVTKPEIENRKQHYAFMTLEPEKVYFTSNVREIKEILNEHCMEFSADSDTLKGQIANKGIVKGPAKIIFGKKDLDKVKPGDILITPMTTPNFIVAMEKAAAFVTDEGGITCHAAIISREMKKPCIIGTKVATQVFKDGDLVEVDAEIGIVKKIK